MKRTYGLPEIREKRPRRRRTCLGCNRSMVTTADRRLCPRCEVAAADLLTGTIAEASSVLTRINVSDAL